MLDHADNLVIAQQLGRPPKNVVEVAARCPAGHPCVITCYPLQAGGDSDNKLQRDDARRVPFPTLYWLTCPRVSAQLAHLERDGKIGEVEDAIAGDETLRNQLDCDHENYIAKRWQLLAAADQLHVAEANLHDAFMNRGIGGMKNRQAIKCLHLHFAHHLAESNAVGQLIADRYDIHLCIGD